LHTTSLRNGKHKVGELPVRKKVRREVEVGEGTQLGRKEMLDRQVLMFCAIEIS
jgi:hypothetical protein